MIDFKTNYNGRIIKISDNWCDENTIEKIKKIMGRLHLTEKDIIDWEIVVGEEIYPTEESKKLSNEFGDKYVERDRYVTMTINDMDSGEERIMGWDEALDLEIREDEGDYIELCILFVR